MVLFLKNVFSALFMKFLAKKIKFFKFRKIGKYDEEKVYFPKKRFQLFKSLFLQKWEGRKYAGASRPSC